jgi:8-oxo-dGTP diphosphatase
VTDLKKEQSTMAQEPKTTVAAIIIDQDSNGEKVLLTRRKVDPFKDEWCLPGGHVDAGELPIAAVIREVKEETNLDFYARFFGSFLEDIPQYDQKAFVQVFEGYGRGAAIAAPNEVLEARWFPLDEARSMQLAFWHNEILDVYADPNKRAERREELLKEYDALRSEVLQRMNLRYQSLTLAISATGIFIAAVAGQFVPPVTLLLYPLLAVCIAVAWAQNDIRVGQMGQRIRDDIEQQLGGIKWENWLSAQFARTPVFLYRHSTELTAIGILVGTEILAIVLAISFHFVPEFQERRDLGVAIPVLYSVLAAVDALAVAFTIWLVSLRRREFRKE